MAEWSTDMNKFKFLTVQWMGVVRDRRVWSNHAEAYIQEWIENG